MFRVGDIVVYGWSGVVRIEEIKELPFGEGLYYVLRPVSREETVYVPIENKTLVSRMHPVLSAREADEVIASMAGEPLSWIENENARKQMYREVFESGDRIAIARLLKMLWQRRDSLQSSGRRLRMSDEKTMREAERILYDEFSCVWGIPQGEVEAKIAQCLL